MESENIEYEVEPESWLHPNNFQAVMIIQLSRIYDLLAILARNVDAAATDTLIELHENGVWLSPPPAYTPFEENDEQ